MKNELDLIIDNMFDAALIVRGNGELTINQAAKRILPEGNYNSISDITRLTNLFRCNGSKIQLDELVLKTILNNKTYENRIVLRNKDRDIYLDIKINTSFDESGKPLFNIICCHDVSKIVEYEHILNDFTEVVEVPILRISYPDFNIVYINKIAIGIICEAYKIDHIDPGDIKGSKVSNIVSDFLSEWNLNIIQSLVKKKEIQVYRDYKVCIRGKETYFNIIYQPIKNMHNEIAEIILMLVDVTSEVMERKTIEKLKNMQEEFFSFITHELRTPLTNMSSSIQLMELMCVDEMTPRIHKYIHMIKRNTMQQLRLINNLLDITRAQSGYLKAYKRNMDIVAATRAISESIQTFAISRKIHVIFHTEYESKIIAMDDEKFERIILNILSNAIKFTPENKNVYIKLYPKGEDICIEIKDEGYGIPKDKQNVIFERFGQANTNLTRESEGAGIGLCLVKLLVDAVGGKITLKSDEGKGSTFKIFLHDDTVSEGEQLMFQEFTNDRLVQILNIEFSGIY